ncbi:DsrE family protein [Furfurilactobacillus siliginis]|nr:DsrE family protein [Furfurilactobacillus siliginis]GEK27737.1 sulfur reduction protein DsrE [Furfurilactobacillus siliginis]
MRRKVVFHIDEIDQWQRTSQNIHNLCDYVATVPEEQLQVIVVVNGDAIQGYLQAIGEQTVAQHPSVKFHACHNAMQKHHINGDQLPAAVQIVPVGVLDLIQLQAAGFAYIKP